MRSIPVLVLALCLASACGGSSHPGDASPDLAGDVEVAGHDAADDAIPADGYEQVTEVVAYNLWPAPEPFPAPGGEFVAAHPGVFARLSRWTEQAVAGPDRPDPAHLAAYGAGNGWVHAFVGLGNPLNTLHSLVGPTYEKRDVFFGDYGLRLATRGASEAPGFDQEWATRSLDAPVLLTLGRLDGLELLTVDFAPWTQDVVARRCFLRVLLVTNRRSGASPDLELRVRANNQPSPGPTTALFEVRNARGLLTSSPDSQATVAGKELHLAVGVLQPGETRRLTLQHCTQDGTQAPTAPHLDADSLLDQTSAAYLAWEAGLTDLDTPDPMVNDFWDGMKQTLKVQMSAQGASCPMSEYTRTWARDNIGPALAYLDLGAFDEVRGMLQYLHGAIVASGDLQNSYDADLTFPDPPPPEPDWGAMPPLAGRAAAETPSFMVMMAQRYLLASGDLDTVRSWAPLLRRCLLGQAPSPEGLLPFTGDETFRAAMNAAAGLTLEYAHHEKTWSLNSSLLWLGAERALQRLAADDAVFGPEAPAVAQAAAAQRALIEAGLARFALPDGCLSPFIDRATMEPWAGVFEDVSLQAVWAEAFPAGDPRAAKAVQCLLDRVHPAPGIFQSPLDDRFKELATLPVKVGMYTGMLAGYALASLADLGHPEAEAAFHALRLVLDPSGNAVEYGVYDDHSALHILHDPTGGLGDYTARFRPWEGGIDADALFRFLVRAEFDAATGTVTVQPRLPEGWPGFKVRHLRSGSKLYSLEVWREAGQVKWALEPEG
jgi:hypothetical protein